MAVELTSQLERKIDDLVATGRFANANDVVDEAVGLLKRKLERESLMSSIDDAFSAMERGEGIEILSGFWELLDRAADEAEKANRPLNPDVLP
jgi:Arc/MetJ-type ribon-helix-helix transcriptional regulator